MLKAAFIALPRCVLGNVSPLLESIVERAWRLRVVSLDGRPVTTAEGLRLQPDASAQDAVPVDLNLCILPGGNYEPETWEDLRLHRFLRQFDGRRGWFAAASEGLICLASANLLGGVKYSAPAALTDLYGHLLQQAIVQPEPVTVDGNLISSDGSDAQAFAKTVFRQVQIGQDRL